MLKRRQGNQLGIRESRKVHSLDRQVDRLAITLQLLLEGLQGLPDRSSQLALRSHY